MPSTKREKKVARSPLKKRAKRVKKQGMGKTHKAAPYDLEDLLVEMVINTKEKALSNWSSSKHGRRKGRKVGFPRFKGSPGV